MISSLALFLALTGGTAVALSGSNTVFSDDIVDGQIKAADLAPGAVRSATIANGTIASADLAPRTGRTYARRLALTGGLEPKTGSVLDVPRFGRLVGSCGVSEPPYYALQQQTDFQNKSGAGLNVFVDTGTSVQHKVIAPGASFGPVGAPLPGHVTWQLGRGSGAQTNLMTVTTTLDAVHPGGNDATASCLFQAQAVAQAP